MKKSVIFVTAAWLVACADQAPMDPGPAPAASVSIEDRRVDLGACDSLRVPDGHKLALHVYAQGVQIYRWNGTSWSFVAPQAVLTADAGGRGKVGDHYAGPTWESMSGSKVVGAVARRCTPDPTAVPWLLLSAVSSEGPGIFGGVTFIQRINTVGGNAPAVPGDVVNQEARVPYTTEYLFYRAQ